MAIKDGYIRWSDEAVGAIRWDTEEKEGMAVVIDEANGETYEIGRGGGGDLIHTITLTVLNEESSDTIAYYLGNDIADEANGFICGEFSFILEDDNVKVTFGEPVTLQAGFYNPIIFWRDSVTDPEYYTVTGDAEVVENSGVYAVSVSGNCTISVPGTK